MPLIEEEVQICGYTGVHGNTSLLGNARPSVTLLLRSGTGSSGTIECAHVDCSMENKKFVIPK
jgi:hypothetical protein